MKKLLNFPVGIVLGLMLGLSTGAFATVQIDFTDEDSFESWYQNSVYDLAEAGVINGYSDGSFGPANNVNRAELSVILDRYESGVVRKSIEDDMIDVVESLVALENEDYTHKEFIIMAESGILEPEEDLGAWILDREVLDQVDGTFPTGYTLYEYSKGGEEKDFFLNYEGSRCEGDTCEDVVEWYRY